MSVVILLSAYCCCSFIKTQVGHTRKSVLQLLNAAVSCSVKFDRQHASNVICMLSSLLY